MAGHTPAGSAREQRLALAQVATSNGLGGRTDSCSLKDSRAAFSDVRGGGGQVCHCHKSVGSTQRKNPTAQPAPFGHLGRQVESGTRSEQRHWLAGAWPVCGHLPAEVRLGVVECFRLHPLRVNVEWNILSD